MADDRDLTNTTCKPCHGDVEKLSAAEAQRLMADLPEQWMLADDDSAIVRQFTFKGFAKVVYLTNLLVYLADKEGHHPDVSFGWGYCRVKFTTHDIDGLSENDFICAQKLEKLIAI